MKIHHIGYLVKNMDLARRQFYMLGYKKAGEVLSDSFRKADIQFLEKDGYRIELVCPAAPDSVVNGLLKRYRNAPYHICYETDDLEETAEYLQKDGFTRMDTPCPAPAIDGRRVCFFWGTGIGITEILEGQKKS